MNRMNIMKDFENLQLIDLIYYQIKITKALLNSLEIPKTDLEKEVLSEYSEILNYSERKVEIEKFLEKVYDKIVSTSSTVDPRMESVETGYPELLVQTKVKVLFKKILPSLKNYRKSDKGLADEIRKNFYNLISNVSKVGIIKSRRKFLAQEAQGDVLVLKMLFEIARENKNISHNFYRHIQISLTEISKMLGGLITSKNK